MSEKILATITRNRLDDWKKTLEECDATPIVMLGVGHGAHEGELHLFFPDNTPEAVVRGVLRFALQELDLGSRPI